ncbi:peptidoglycan DD-metalloendopeptidase family protein [Pasteuria penetrans]|uniref:peptidoglycan DD-metalloendopeptidase family protein n=1 Tax=Pasteuria penetrans TaxID=86005 RepID=UPI0011EC67A6|nr:peptidoglycan DD-metalloendopeptidase family protein [Pasteuria penetrans]
MIDDRGEHSGLSTGLRRMGFVGITLLLCAWTGSIMPPFSGDRFVNAISPHASADEDLSTCRAAAEKGQRELNELQNSPEYRALLNGLDVMSARFEDSKYRMGNLLRAMHMKGYSELLASLFSSDSIPQFLRRVQAVQGFLDAQKKILLVDEKNFRNLLKQVKAWRDMLDSNQEKVEIVNQACAVLKRGVLSQQQRERMEDEGLLDQLLDDVPEPETGITLKGWKEGKARFGFKSFTIRPSQGRISSAFGYRMHPIKKKMALHRGIDFSGRLPIYAPGPGLVVGARSAVGYGVLITIYHGRWKGRNIFSRYGHCFPKDVRVRIGQRVQTGDLIAYSGNNGDSAGTHLHFEVCKSKDVCSRSDLVDPALYLPPD